MRPQFTTPLALDSHFAAYLAGIVDGEGCFSISRGTKRVGESIYTSYRPLLNIVNTHHGVLEEIRQTVGHGGLYRVPHSVLRRREAWQYMVYGRSAQAVTRAIYPYLRIKREQADALLTFIPKPNRNGRSSSALSMDEDQERIYWQVKALNQRGPVPFEGV
jgi:hypothetical protein